MKNIMPAAIVVAVILGFGLTLAHSSCAKPDVELLSPGVARADADPKLIVAVKHAQKTLDSFIEAYQHPKPGQLHFFAQAAFDTPKGKEHLWALIDTYRDGVFTGRLIDEPYALPGKHKKDTVRFKREEVTDWTFDDNGKRQGGFTR